MSEPVKCKCGCTLFWRTYKAMGRWETLVEIKNGRLEVVQSSTDGIRQSHLEPKTMTCTECKKRVPNPDYV